MEVNTGSETVDRFEDYKGLSLIIVEVHGVLSTSRVGLIKGSVPDFKTIYINL